MKKASKTLIVLFVVAVIAMLSIGLVACNDDDDYTARTEGQVIRFTAPEGTPALAMLRLKTDNPTLDGTTMQYEVVKAQFISVEMTDKRSDVLIMPINAGAKLINSDKTNDYKLVSVAVEGSLFVIGKKSGGNVLTFDDIKGKKVACIGQNNVPGLTFEYILKNNGIDVIYSGEPNGNQVLIQYVGNAAQASTAYEGEKVSFMVVGEPDATVYKGRYNLNAEMNLQQQYSLVNPEVNGDSYPQAGLFVRAALAKDKKFMNALFDALDRSEDWIDEHASEVTAFAQQHLYPNADFPAASLPRCAIECDRLDGEDQNEIIAFLKNIMPTDSMGNVIDWDGLKSRLF